MGTKLKGTGVEFPDGTEQTTAVTDSTGISPTGAISMYAGSTAPSGWLLCEGQEVSRTTYSGLFNVIGTTYGSASGTTFTLPKLKGRSPLGSDSAGTVLNNTEGWNTYEINSDTEYFAYRLQTIVSQSSTWPSLISYKMIKFFDENDNDVSTDKPDVDVDFSSGDTKGQGEFQIDLAGD